jgi:hypothetical protein
MVAVSAYVASKVNVAKAEQVKQDVAPVHEQAKAEKQEAKSGEDSNQKLLAATLAAIANQRQQPVSTQVDYDRIARMIEERMGAKATVKADPEHPDAPSAVVPAKQLRDYMSDCDEKGALLGSCRISVENITKERDAEIKDHAATKLELEAARKAMKGGGFLKRAKSNGKWAIMAEGRQSSLSALRGIARNDLHPHRFRASRLRRWLDSRRQALGQVPRPRLRRRFVDHPQVTGSTSSREYNSPSSRVLAVHRQVFVAGSRGVCDVGTLRNFVGSGDSDICRR